MTSSADMAPITRYRRVEILRWFKMGLQSSF
jgi:hypothetical protein